MRTTINIPDEVIADLLKFTKTSSKSEAITIAIKDWLNYKRIQKLKSLRGKLPIDINLNKIRNAEMNESVSE